MSRVVVAFVSLLLGFQVGCASPDGGATYSGGSAVEPAQPAVPSSTSTEYRPGDRITIDFADNSGVPSNWEQTVREDGTITLPLGKTIKAAGLKKGELETGIRDLYVPHTLRRLTVNVRAEQRSYFVSGEVKNPGQKEHTGLITALKAVAAAGDFTDYADKSEIDVIRSSGEKVRVNGKKVMKGEIADVPVYPGDTVRVHRRWF